MRTFSLFLLFALSFQFGFSQGIYFPPNNSEEWETVSPADLGWCVEEIDTLYQFLEDRNTRAFILLKDGRIALEQYFGSFTQDSLWYWASAGKSLTAFLTGVAQEEGYLSIEDPVSDYLGSGWTNTTPDQEEAIKIRHQISMTTGLDEDVPNQNCLTPSCLNYLAAPDTRWYYYNAPYRLVLDVLAEAVGMNINQYTFTRLNPSIGFSGLWFNYVFYSKPRMAARFGLLALNEGVWNGASVLSDTNYFQNMVNTSQNFNLSYGYLWWLNGKGSHMLPQTDLVFQSDLIPNAPDDLIAALGANDQKIHVVPSQGLVMVRMGDASGQPALAASSFDNQLWANLNNLFCNTTSTNLVEDKTSFSIFPNPVDDWLNISSEEQLRTIEIYQKDGRLISKETLSYSRIFTGNLDRGIYFLKIRDQSGRIGVTRFIKAY